MIPTLNVTNKSSLALTYESENIPFPYPKDVPFCWGLNITLKGFLDDDDDDDDDDDGFSSTEKLGEKSLN